MDNVGKEILTDTLNIEAKEFFRTHICGATLKNYEYSYVNKEQSVSFKLKVERLKCHDFLDSLDKILKFDRSTSKVDIDMLIPEIILELDKSTATADICGFVLKGEARGWLKARKVRVVGDVAFKRGHKNTVNLSCSNLNINIDKVESDLELSVGGVDYSSHFQTFISNKAVVRMLMINLAKFTQYTLNGMLVTKKLRKKSKIIVPLLEL